MQNSPPSFAPSELPYPGSINRQRMDGWMNERHLGWVQEDGPERGLINMEELMLSNCAATGDSGGSRGQQGDPTSPS